MECDTVLFQKVERYDYIKEINVNHLFTNKNIIKTIHSSDKKVNVWTLDNINRVRKLTALGVDGVITNFPNKIC